ncbi:hypothetical protein JD844_012753 [Phrynosoma platyrhinos]|uniref:FYVE, RhoGEF and PH domain containing 3 n=1 Tax=Phrynosoma platyrhinos TaxID=52577 RepID=A0ABQ7TL63_PHRPL|nr:hypothetical protein JD844_012753 [Phrynosoma platyrhinos]
MISSKWIVPLVQNLGPGSQARPSVPCCPHSSLEIKCHIEPRTVPETCGELQFVDPVECTLQAGRKPKIKSHLARKHPLSKPQVPPKPVYLQPAGQEKIPPAPSRPLPADPKSSRSPVPEEEITQTSGVINRLIEKFESIRQPIHAVQRNQFNLAFKMEPGIDSSKQCCLGVCDMAASSATSTNEIKEQEESEPGILCSTEMSNADIMKIKELNIDDTTATEDCADGNVSKVPTEEVGHKDSLAELNGNGKIPNRDSGIDSPSCSVAGDTFLNEDGSEQRKATVSGSPAADMENDKKGVRLSTGEQKRDSAQDEDSDIDEGSSEEQETAEVSKLECVDINKLQCSEPQKLFNIANELLHTEEAYVKRLHLLDQVFCTKLYEAGIPPDVVTGIFSNISSIYRFHEQFLLPELKTRITDEWNTNPRLGDIFQKLAPFLKMYGEYVKNFDRAMDMVNTWMQRSSPFKDVIQNIQIFGGESLELISTAANHSNAAIRKMEKMHKLLEVYERLGGEEDIVNPANELIKEGHIQKLSAKNGTAQDRTEEEKKEWIQVFQATIEKHKQNSETFRAFNNSFSQEDDHLPDSSIASTSSVESMPGTDGSNTSGGPECCRKSSKLKRDKEKNACKSCGESFNSITKRRHHCKQCGTVICAKCSEFKTLADNSRQNRVCKDCFQLPSAVPCISGNENAEEQNKKMAIELYCTPVPLTCAEPASSLIFNLLQPTLSMKKQNILGAENNIFSSYLLFQEKGKNWCKVWVTIPKAEPLVLYLQGGSQDGRVPRSIPLLGYEVDFPHSGEKFESKYVFKLSQSQQTLYFSADDEDLQIKWMDILTKAAKGETQNPSEEASNP